MYVRLFFSLIILYPIILQSQIGDYQTYITSSGNFNILHTARIPENLDLMLECNRELRIKYRIKSITRKLSLYDNYSDSLIEKDPRKNFHEGHTSLIEYSFYNRDGLLEGNSIVPLNVRLSKEDSVYYRSIKISTDTTKHEYIIDYYCKNELFKRCVYQNLKLVLIKSFNDVKRIGNIKDGTLKDTSYFCDSFVQISYDENGNVSGRIYNNTEYMNLKRPCDIIESETYEYKKQKIIITKVPYREDKTWFDKYINVIELNKKGRVVKSSFCGNKINDVWQIYTCEYDANNNLVAIFKTWNPKDLKAEKQQEFENIYDKKGNLVTTSSITTTRFPWKDTYHFNIKGLLDRIEYGETGKNFEIYEYQYY